MLPWDSPQSTDEAASRSSEILVCTQHNAVRRIGCAVGTLFSITVLSHAALYISSMNMFSSTAHNDCIPYLLTYRETSIQTSIQPKAYALEYQI